MRKIAVEIGGTFTDFIVAENGHLHTLKVPSTPPNPALAVLSGLEQLGFALADVGVVLHGSTVATNAVIERKGSRCAMITTEGFRDILEFQRELKSHNYDIFYAKPTPLVSRDMILEARERLGADGRVIQPLDADAFLAELRRFAAGRGVDSFAVCLLHAYSNPEHERAVNALVAQVLPGVPCFASSEILREFREYERASTTVINAFVAPTLDRYISTIEGGLAERAFAGDFHIMQSNGGIIPAAAARVQGVRTIMSGPAAGVRGAVRVAARAKISNIITLDMGGTSTDVCLVNAGHPEVTTEGTIDGLPIRTPMLDIVSVGAGGGSIAWTDQGGMLRVGPQSAGADPGPACYGKSGTEMTVTDAYVLSGLVRPHRFLGGRFGLERAAAEAAAARRAADLGMSTVGLSDAVYRIATSNMAYAMRLVSIERGYDPRDYVLVAFGGAGPLHAAFLAKELGTRGALIPPMPGLLSAYGLLVADFQRDYVQTQIARLERLSPDAFWAQLETLEALATEELCAYRIATAQLINTWSVDMRYAGQAYELNIPFLPDDVRTHGLLHLAALFHDTHKRRYGHAFPSRPVIVVNYRLTVRLPMPDLPLPAASTTGRPVFDETPVVLSGHEMLCRFVERAALPGGATIHGPVVIEEPTSATLVPPGWAATVDENANIHLQESVA